MVLEGDDKQRTVDLHRGLGKCISCHTGGVRNTNNDKKMKLYGKNLPPVCVELLTHKQDGRYIIPLLLISMHRQTHRAVDTTTTVNNRCNKYNEYDNKQHDTSWAELSLSDLWTERIDEEGYFVLSFTKQTSSKITREVRISYYGCVWIACNSSHAPPGTPPPLRPWRVHT